MGKVTDSALKRYKNVRVDPATLSHYMCYYCGKMSSDRLEYQQHMLKVHEVMSQSYQLWSDHTMDTLGLRWSRSKPSETSRSVAASPRSTVSKMRDSEEDDEDYVYEMEERPAKRRKKDEEKAKSTRRKNEEARRKMEAETKRRKRLEEKRKEEARKAEEVQKEEEKVATQVLEEKKEVVEEAKPAETTADSVVVEKKKRRRTDRKKEVQTAEGDKSEVTALVKKILEESKKKEASSQEVEDEDVPDVEKITETRKPLEANSKTTRYCKVCKKGTHYNFASLFEHYIDHHHAVLKSFHYYGYRGRELLARKLLLEREFCQRCCLTFATAKDYYVHMIHNHIVDSVRGQIAFENATNADVEAKLEFRERIITCGYNFKFEEPDQTFAAIEPAMSADDSQADTEEETSMIQEPETTESATDLTN